MTEVWSFPTRILFAEGAASHTGAEALRLGGKKALIVSDEGVDSAGLLETITNSLAESKVDYDLFTGISSNPLEKELLAATEAYADAKANIVVAVGGGSPLDVGKIVRVTATHPGPLAQYDDAAGGASKILKPLPPMIAIPTTAGTGSEVGRSGVVTLAATNRKTVFFAPQMIPSVAILDPRLSISMPPLTTAATGFDALTHNIEAYCAKGDHPMADAIALAGIALVAEYLETAVETGSDIEARGAMLKAAMMGAVAFQKGLGACHSLAHPLSAECGLHHGLANALCLPAVLDFNRSVVPDRIAQIAQLLGVRGDDEETLAFECSGAVRSLRRKVGLPDGLGAAEVDEDLLPRLAELAFEDGCHQLNPRECTEEDMRTLYRASM